MELDSELERRIIRPRFTYIHMYVVDDTWLVEKQNLNQVASYPPGYVAIQICCSTFNTMLSVVKWFVLRTVIET